MIRVRFESNLRSSRRLSLRRPKARISGSERMTTAKKDYSERRASSLSFMPRAAAKLLATSMPTLTLPT
jgi:hypothetical protein